MTQKEMENLKPSIIIEEIENAVRNLSQRKKLVSYDVP